MFKSDEKISTHQKTAEMHPFESRITSLRE